MKLNLTNEYKKLIDEMIAEMWHYSVSESLFRCYIDHIKKGTENAKDEFVYILTECNFHKEAKLIIEDKLEEAMAAYLAA